MRRREREGSGGGGMSDEEGAGWVWFRGCLGLLEGSDACSSSICRFSRTLLPQEWLLQAVAALHANFCLPNCT